MSWKKKFLSALQDGTGEDNDTIVKSSEYCNFFFWEIEPKNICETLKILHPIILKTGLGYQNVIIVGIRNHLFYT